MINKEQVTILSSKTIALDTFEMVLNNHYISQHAKPGQFLHIYVEGHTLRRPISIANVDPEQETITVLFKRMGAGTQKIATYQPGMVLDVLGPSGNGFYIDSNDSTVLLIGGGIGVPPLYFLGKTLAKQGRKIISVLGFQSKQHVFYEQEFKALGETIIVTNDGSFGEQGFVTDVMDSLGQYDCYYSCGPLPMLQAITAIVPNQKGYISLEERMGCGVGACFACVIPTADEAGYRKICKDGPVFSAKEVTL
ncbi:dihydroorotate dehydrogenase electron transfer subunit [Ornithinibacillus sp. L9]|uniref:Dihydroorotate dehydrogenase B (NAD(+)), electron transfer subunit n=1 Tax=Ornithinibacillus caprae TaxID=2678566 RepID=A0A6N8FPT0_9BACI|nr:dihydroorotate dehydrogenase electron transfer subunit [Ornithinibacillus caprae]MUK89508.1 dihydroorotate dehydrogenase electron transfer subunit [Ornithinibacillus caprae]